MPIPVYFLMAQSVVEDKTTNFVSVFNLFETIDGTPISAQPRGEDGTVLVQWEPTSLIAVWMIDLGAGEKPGDDYENEFNLRVPDPSVPGGVRRMSLAGGRFQFPEAQIPTEPSQMRFVLRLGSPLPIIGPGVLYAEHGVRRPGATDWLVQTYPILIRLSGNTDAATAPAG